MTILKIDTVQNASGGNYPIIPGHIIKVTHSTNTTRNVPSTGSNFTLDSIAFTKEKGPDDSYLVIKGLISAWQDNNTGIYYNGYIDSQSTGWYSTVGISDHESGDRYAGNNALWLQTFYGVTAGSHTYYRGVRSRDGSSNKPAVTYQNNSSDDARNRQQGSPFIVFEVAVNSVG
jgi:hypothetical protein